MELYRLKCVACHRGDPPLSHDEIIKWHREIPKWEVRRVDGIQQLTRIFMFRNFSQSMIFANRVSKIAEEEHHHPSIFIDYDEVTLGWWTYKIKGLHLNDFIMAARTDNLLRLHPLE